MFRLRALVLIAAFSAALAAQQPNSPAASLFVQHRQGPPYPIVTSAPVASSVTWTVGGNPGARFVLCMAPAVSPVPTPVGGASIDIGIPPWHHDVVILANGFEPGSPYVVSPSGFATFTAPIGPVATPFVLPAAQALVEDPTVPGGATPTAATQITLMPSKRVLFLQGDYDPGFGFGPHCRINDPSPIGFSQLRDLLLAVGFHTVAEVVDTTITIDPWLLSQVGVLVLGTNRRTFTTAEVDAIVAFVRSGGGLVSYADSMFGPGAHASDNQVLSRFGLLCAQDNFGGVQTATAFATHPVSAGLAFGVQGEGVSIIEIVGNGVDVIHDVTPCALNGTACLPYPAVAPSGSSQPTYSACAVVDAGAGRVVATFDRNTFFNVPGYGSSIGEASNLVFAVNLFLHAGGY